jgi:hypothetical protein
VKFSLQQDAILNAFGRVRPGADSWKNLGKSGVNTSTIRLNKKLALAGGMGMLGTGLGLYLAFLPMALPWFPDFVTTGVLEWASLILAVGGGVCCWGLLVEAFRCTGVAWWVLVTGILAASVPVIVAIMLLLNFVLLRLRFG